MRKHISFPCAVLGGSLVLAAASAPAAADQPTKLADHELDVVTAGAAGSAFGGDANANGSMYSLSFVNGMTSTSGNSLVQWSSGFIVASASGASSTPGTASADAGTGGFTIGDSSIVRTVDLPDLGSSDLFGAAAVSLTFGVAVGGS
jgi:hypothetical protein